MEIILGLKNKVLERLAFTMLCLAKLNNIKNPKNNGWVNAESKEKNSQKLGLSLSFTSSSTFSLQS